MANHFLKPGKKLAESVGDHLPVASKKTMVFISKTGPGPTPEIDRFTKKYNPKSENRQPDGC